MQQTPDLASDPPPGAQSSPAAARNVQPILQVLKAHLPGRGRVLEIAAGSGQHAVAFAAALPDLDWTPSDPSPEARTSIDAWATASGATNLRAALDLDVTDPGSWPEGPVEAVVCINMIHISPWAATEGLMTLAARMLVTNGLLYLYGPYLEADTPLAPSNAAFDASLKARDSAWGLRDRDAVVALAADYNLAFTFRRAMPANNLSLLFRRLP